MAITAQELGDFVDNEIETLLEKAKKELADNKDNQYLYEWYKGQVHAYSVISIKLNSFICKNIVKDATEFLEKTKKGTG